MCGSLQVLGSASTAAGEATSPETAAKQRKTPPDHCRGINHHRHHDVSDQPRASTVAPRATLRATVAEVVNSKSRDNNNNHVAPHPHGGMTDDHETRMSVNRFQLHTTTRETIMGVRPGEPAPHPDKVR